MNTIQKTDIYTGETIDFVETEIYFDGSTMIDLYIDNIIYIKESNTFYKRYIENHINVKWFGATGKDTNNDNDTIAFQNAIDFCSRNASTLYIPEGVYRITDSLKFPEVKPVNNDSKFGLKIFGENLSSIIKFFGSNSSDKILFDFYTNNDIQIHMSNLVLIDQERSNNFAIRFGKLDRYSIFEKVRILEFGVGLIFQKAIYRITFNDIYIRGCKKHSILVDNSQLTNPLKNTLTEFVFNRCYIDNNGSGNIDGYHLSLYNCQEFKFNDCIFEGNFSFGLQITGSSENISFNNCRFEETFINTEVSSGHIHSFENSTRNIVFRMCEIAYSSKGYIIEIDKDGCEIINYVKGNKNYSLFYIQNNTKFEDCQFIDLSNENPENVFGMTPDTAVVQVINPYLGIGNDYKLKIPNRYQFIKIGKLFVWENNNQTRSKIDFPLNDLDGQLGIL